MWYSVIIFSKEKKLFIEKNKEYINHPFYNFGGIKTTFNEIKNFLINPNFENKLTFLHYLVVTKKIIYDLFGLFQLNLEMINNNKNKEDNIQMTFEYIDSQDKLALPLFYKILTFLNLFE